MPRQRNLYNRRTYVLPEDFPQRLRRFQEESGLSWSEIARRLETYRHTVWCWKEGRARPNYQHRKALLELADGVGPWQPVHKLSEASGWAGAGSGKAIKALATFAR